ncbi:cupin domain-containing protein [Parahaliea mediterranea]|uniref:Cupin domain-containing protein n=1 Tax=Parahaliea mediterranea TaxID=651086 RepID=A0A939IPG5_9GAMM|nr:cupin domain-containing protein [Parahaliea mediterranea]MBN7799143.1 cupin domain-containing protein [Parahaliea mediterranea]
MTRTLRRVVTTNNADGQSEVALDGGPAAAIAAHGSGLHEIWQTASVPADNSRFEDALAGTDPRLCPPPGGVKVRWFEVPPENDAIPAEEKEAAAAFSFEAVGASGARVDTRRHPLMHKTDSVDYIVLVKGELDMLLDNGEIEGLKPGDVVVQRGTNHAWVNRGSEPALLVAVLVDAAS